MKETIIYAPSCNKTELLRSLARLGKSTIGIRIVDSKGLVERALLESGKLEYKNIRTAEDCIIDIYQYLNGDDCHEYFVNSKSYDDAKVIYSSLNVIRTRSKDRLEDIFNKLEANDKNRALKHLIDNCVFDDLISYIKEIINNDEYKKIAIKNADIITFDEYPLNPLEQALLDKLSNKKYISKRILCYFDKVHFAKAYGNGAETEWIISTILNNGYSFDECAVCYTDSSYPELFYALSKVHNIPMTFSSGISIANSTPGKLLKLIQHWSGFGHYGIEAFKKIINSTSFDREKFKKDIGIKDDYQLGIVVKAAASLRLSFDKDRNLGRIEAWKGLNEANRFELQRNDKNHDLYTDAVIKIAEILNNGITKLLEYSKNIEVELNKTALSSITSRLSSCIDKSIKLTDDIYESIFSNSIMHSLCKEGALHIVPIEKAMSSLRKYFFICGLTASYFPGKLQEDPLFSDEEIGNVIGESCEAYSKKVIRERNTLLECIVNTTLESSEKVYLSYPCYNTADLKTQNPSSKFFEISSGREVEEIGYFSSNITPGLYNPDSEEKKNNEKSDVQEKNNNELIIKLKDFDKTKQMSPSEIKTFVECPRRFYLQYVEKIPNESPDETTLIIPPTSFGELIHDLMKDTIRENKKHTENEIKNIAEQRTKEFLKRRIPIIDSVTEINREVEDVKKTAWATYQLHNANKGCECVATEEKLERTYEDEDIKFRFSGYVDRIDRLKDGKYKIIDYKTGRTVKHDPKKRETFIQALLYAYMYEKDVSSCEFWYPRVNKSISSSYEQTEIKKTMRELHEAINAKKFYRKSGDENCKYCNFKDICKWPFDDETIEGAEK